MGALVSVELTELNREMEELRLEFGRLAGLVHEAVNLAPSSGVDSELAQIDAERRRLGGRYRRLRRRLVELHAL